MRKISRKQMKAKAEQNGWKSFTEKEWRHGIRPEKDFYYTAGFTELLALSFSLLMITFITWMEGLPCCLRLWNDEGVATMGRKWMYFVTSFESLACKLKEACEEAGIKCEFSGCFESIHGAFLVNERECQFLNKIIEYNSIREE